MPAFFVVVILSSIILSAWEYRKLILSIQLNNSQNLCKFLEENILADFLGHMNNEKFKEFCIAFFKSSGVPAMSEYENILYIKGWKEDMYIKYLTTEDDRPVQVKEAMELYGAMCHDSIKKGIIITNSKFDDKTTAFCREVNINTMDIDDILYEIKNLKEDEVQDLLPGLNS